MALWTAGFGVGRERFSALCSMFRFLFSLFPDAKLTPAKLMYQNSTGAFYFRKRMWRT